MKNITLIISLLVTLTAITSCKKKNSATTAAINFTEIAEGDTIAFGDTVHIEGTIEGNGELHGYQLQLIDIISAETLLTKNSETHGLSYVFDEHWVNNVTTISNLKAVVVVEINHDGDLVTKEVNFVCLPQ
ncbi:MAG: hypothetical protein EBU01_15040 [Crocinitomicaceae bacterium]|nr:hypothetical protein [Crocinitomicaceae bacterium]